MGDWQQVIDLNAQAAERRKLPRTGAELVPLIEAYARTGQWSQALDASLSAQQKTAGLEPLLCSLWTHYPALPDGAGKSAALQSAFKSFGCPG